MKSKNNSLKTGYIPQEAEPRDNQMGALFMTLGMFGFVVNDSLMKLVLVDMPVMQGIFVRGTMAFLGLLLLARVTGSLTGLRRHFNWLLLTRAVGEAGAAFMYLTAIKHLPIATATALLMAMSLFVTLAAALFLGEKVGLRRYMAIVVGFGGVLIILQPGGDGFNIYSLYVLGAIGFMVLRDLSTKMMPRTVPSVLVAGTSMLGVTLSGAVPLLYTGWQPIVSHAWWPLVGAALLLVLGYQFSVLAVRRGDISITAIFRYTSLVWGGLMGYFLFDEIPGWTMWLGSAIIMGAGVYTLYRERRQRLARAMAQD